MASQRDIEYQLNLLVAYRTNLARLRTQEAAHGGPPYAPLEISNRIDAQRQQIREIKRALRARRVDVADHPDDDGGAQSSQPDGDDAFVTSAANRPSQITVNSAQGGKGSTFIQQVGDIKIGEHSISDMRSWELVVLFIAALLLAGSIWYFG